jgi:hypothetical protein
VTGTPPFEASNYNALIRRILREAPKPTTEHGVGDAQFWTIIERCLKKDVEQRWASMWELGEALALWLFERGVRVDAASRSLKHDWLESGVTGLQILVPSEAPDGRSQPPLARVEPLSAPDLPSPTIEPTQITRRKTRNKSWPLSLMGLVLASAGLLAFVVLRPRLSARVFAEERAQAAVSPQVVVPVSPVADAPAAAPPAVPAPIPSALPLVSASATAAPAVSARAPSRAPGSSPTATRSTSPQKASPRRGLNTEFGF